MTFHVPEVLYYCLTFKQIYSPPLVFNEWYQEINVICPTCYIFHCFPKLFFIYADSTLLLSFFGGIKMLCFLMNLRSETGAGNFPFALLIVLNAQVCGLPPNPTELGHLSLHTHSLFAKLTHFAL